MRARLLPVAIGPIDDPAFCAQTERLRQLLGDVAELADPLPLGDPLPAADAVLLPQLVGEAYGRVPELRALSRPILVVTSEFGTMSMWDWELTSYLRSEGVATLVPYTLEGARTACRALAARTELARSRLLVFQDQPGAAGVQPDIFRRFYWWEPQARERIERRFGCPVVTRSLGALGAAAKAIADPAADAAWEPWRSRVPVGDADPAAVRSAVKLHLALREAVAAEGPVVAAGANCLNESSACDTTPCLAWNLLYQERQLIWGCEADTLSMLTEYLVHRSLGAPVVMTNLYPFLLGQAALRHERIPAFPDVERPEDCVLAAHCGYLGVLPQPMAGPWRLRAKVLAIVDERSAVIDARLPEGAVTLAKLGPTLESLVVVEGELTGYAEYPASDCRTGAVIRVPSGHALVRGLPSHHSILVAGHHREGFELLAAAFGLRVDRLGG